MDNEILNLSTFGEIIKKPESAKELTFADVLSQLATSQQMPESPIQMDEPHEDTSKSEQYYEFIKCSFEYMLCLKMLHWQTFSLGEHKATDKLFNGMIGILDTIVETAMGKYGRPVANDWMIPVCNYESPEHLQKFLAGMAECYSTKCKGLFDPKTDSEIINTLDTLIELINKTRYLVTLK